MGASSPHLLPSLVTDSPSLPPSSTQVNKGPGERAIPITLFVNLDNIGLRLIPRLKSLHQRTYGVVVLAMAAFVSITPLISAYSTSCFQSRVISYNDFSGWNFDGSANQISHMAQICLTSQSHNETYTIKEMVKQPEKGNFV